MTEASSHPAEQELLQQVRWIQGLAFAILRDYQLAQDVSQEVLLRAVSGEARHGRVLRAWLAAVTRNLSVSVLRERDRRESREQRAARPDEAAAVRNPMEILEAHESLTKAIHALPADAREIVLLRFFENLDFPAIAQRLGIREDAARVRLHRALGALRGALTRSDGDWRSWCALALPAGASHLVPASSRIAELLLMKATKPVVLVLTAGLLLLALIFGPDWSRTSQAQLDPAELAAAGLPAPAMADGATAAGDPALERSAAVTAGAAGSWVLRGRVEIPGGGDAGGLRVRAFLHDGYDLECPVLEETVLISEADGALSWPRDPPADAVYVLLEPEAKGVGYGDARLILKGTDPPQDLEVVVFRWTTPVSGVVRNEAGEPIAGARVRGGREEATTDAEGRYQLMGRAGSSEQYLYAEAEGYAQTRMIVSMADGVAGSADFTLQREFRIRGRVLDENGAPVEGVVVDTFGPHRNSVQTDAEGAFELCHLELRESAHQLYARKKGYVEAVADVKAANRTSATQDLELRRGTRLEGRVLGADGSALDGASLFIGFSPNAYNRLDAVAHEDGAFSFPNVPSGRQTLWARHPGYAPAHRVLAIDPTQAHLTGIDLVLTEGHFVAGRVLDPAGNPLEGVWISPRQGWDSLNVNLQTDAEGRFRIEGLPGENMFLSFYKNGLSRIEIPLDVLDQSDLELTMRSAGHLKGRVVDELTGQPIQDFRIRLFDPHRLSNADPPTSDFPYEWAEDGMLIHAADGLWSTEAELQVGGLIGIEARAPGYSPARIDRLVVPEPAQLTILELRLMPGARLRGRVLPSAGGDPIANANLSVLSAADLLPGAERSVVPWPSTLSDEQGSFLLQDLPLGSVYLKITHADWLTSVVGPIDLLPADQTPEQTIQLEVGATLRGRALDAAGQPLAGHQVTAYGRQIPNLPRFIIAAKTDEDGRFSIPHLPDGRYQLYLSLGSGLERKSILSKEHVLRAGEDRESLLQPAGSCSIFGRVTAGVPLPENLQVRLEICEDYFNNPSPLASGLISIEVPVVDGRYKFPMLEPGLYNLNVSLNLPGEKVPHAAHQLVDLKDGASIELNLNLVAEK